jgi:hypothetical protein
LGKNNVLKSHCITIQKEEYSDEKNKEVSFNNNKNLAELKVQITKLFQNVSRQTKGTQLSY